ncbi:6517_t:CDS:2, partial [Racocetra fulgida]
RLDILIKAVEDLMKLTEIISVKCNEYLKEIETEERGAKRVCEAALFVTNGVAFGFALAAKQELSKAIEQQNNTLRRLHEFHLTLTKMTQKGRIILDLSGNEMLDQRNTIIEEFTEFQIQCKSFKDVLDDLEE